MKKLLTALAMLAISVPTFAADQFSLGTGFDYSSGKYGNAVSTDILYIPVTGKYESDKLTLKLTVPYIRISSPGGVTRGIGRIGPANGRTTRTTHSGLGDITASAGYNVYSVNSIALDVVGNVKLGTADTNLGTGQDDYSAQLDGYYTLDKVTLFATAGYKVYVSPAGVNLSSTVYGMIGASQKLSNVTSAGVMLDMAQSPSSSGSDQQEVTVYISQKIAANLKVQANILKGFSNGSPDFGGGVIITGTF